MAKKLFEFKENDWQIAREKSHKTLEQVLSEGKFPHAECRENWGTLTFEVWSDGESYTPRSGHEKE